MAKPYVFITMQIPKEIVALLEDVAHVGMWEADTPCPRDKLLEEAAKADALFTMVVDRIDQEVLKRGQNLKIVANMAVGYDNIDVETAKHLGIMVSNTPDVLTEATADLTFALLMATARRVVEASQAVYEGRWQSWSPMFMAGQDVYGKTLGIVGMGRIGEAVARRARGFDMDILYHNRKPKTEAEEKLGATYCSFEDLLQKADFIVALTPLTDQTRHLFGRREFELMKKTAIFINVSRGPVVDEEALYHALKEKQIWAAGLDVFHQEPVPTDHPLLTLPNVVPLPHIGSASISARMAMARLAAENIVLALTGKKPKTLISEDMWTQYRFK
ncbi:D-isomer specific 2-hydroxyacid dehydrogenase NAD-binding [Caldalkalibacillus thermarum TA2.A1]|uniref:Glyoxylate/hydroxypyruvate reductase B n=1 Tax=Caldalkalibacillus thermarum (strain TA2.A1) TaxID=986075 RepID=F5L3X0_CALTT|nr:D-glycerate dehydrogenase [Caldalkalibacillus thermarum]EGL83964.1 D-isomer specific 2-hydroxyacid dehydrogenase NAD-binding [Caldalkalibacillus thermarum TA2.A1]QZT34682.1 D-glycerate dehydrogenase [Caldalkalibacillus thermarum TA2.A1]